MARLPIPGEDEGIWGDVLNEYLSVAHAVDGKLKSNSVSETELSPAVRTKLNSSGGSAVADSSVTTSKLADGAVTNAKVAAGAAIAQSKIDNLTSDLANKADNSHGHAINDVVGLQTALNNKAASDHTHPAPALNDLSDVNASGATAGQVLTWQGAQWAAADQTGDGGTVGAADHGALAGLVDDDHPQYLNNSRGDARYYTQTQVDTALGDKADATHTHGAAAIDSGIFSPARLGTGTASSSTYLRGDGSWAAPASGATNLATVTTATTVTVNSDTGTDATLAAATTTIAGVMSSTDKTKLDSVATGATANATDSQLRDRSTHTGTQAITTITNLQAALDDKEDSGAVSAHESEADPHANAGYAMMVGGGRRIFVQSNDPGAAASDGDIWIDTTA